MQEMKTLKEQALDRLSVTSGKELDLSCNIVNSRQLEIILESEAHNMLGSQFYNRMTERMLRLTCGFEGRHRQDIVTVASSSKEFGGGDQ